MMEVARKSIIARPTGKRRKLRINVGGSVHETWNHTLERKPGTRLAALARNMDKDESYDAERQEFFFDQHPGVFATVMHYYRSEELHTDYNICGTIIKAELEFWGLTELDIEPCCWGHYNKFKENKETLAALDDNFTATNDDNDEAFGEKPTKHQLFKKRIWLFLEDPASSRAAKIYAITSMFFVLLSISVFVLETHHIFREPVSDYNATSYWEGRGEENCFRTSTTQCCRCNVQQNLPFSESEPHLSMVIMDYICAAFFTIEFLLRIYFAPKKCQFLKEPLNVIDILCLLPHFVSIIIKSVDPTDKSSQIIKLVLALRIIRVLRIFKLMKHYTAFKILVYTIKVSMRELFLMVIFLFTGVLIFASVMFYAENKTFNNIPIGFWWALVTMTTVGYGDTVPTTEVGYVIGSMCVLCGVLVVAFTVPIVVNNFSMYYSHAQSRVRLPPTKRKELQKKIERKNQKAQEFINKLTMNVKRAKAFSNLNAANDKKDNLPNTTPRDTKLDTEALKDRLKPKKNLEPTVSNSTISTVVSSDSSNPCSPTIPTLSASIAELELELPGTPVSNASAEPPSKTSITPQQIETVNLLNGLEDQQEKSEAERQRQLDLIIHRREERRQMRNSPRPAPAPAGNSRSSMESVNIAGANSKKPPLPIQSFRSGQNSDTNLRHTNSVSVRIGKSKIT